MKHFKITPDARLLNDKVEHLTQSLCVYKTLYQRMKEKEQNFFSYEITLNKKNPFISYSVNDGTSELLEKAVLSSYPNVTLTEISDPIELKPTAIKTMGYKNHYFLSLKVDKRSDWLQYLFEVLPLMKEDEKALVQVTANPLHYDWNIGVKEAYERFKKGDLPLKFQFDRKLIGNLALKTTASIVLGAHNLVTELIGGEPEEYDLFATERASLLKDGQLRSETVQKMKYGGYNVQISIAIECDEKRVETLMRAIETAFLAFDGDNRLDSEKRSLKHFSLMKERKISKFITNYFSSHELARVVVLPPKYLQEKYNIENIKIQETQISPKLLKEGLLMGDSIYKGNIVNVLMPIKNWDELCLPYSVIGGMGQGKTAGYGANRIVEAIKNGFGALFIDPAKKQVTEEIKKVLNPDQYEIFNISKLKPSFDWCEAKYSPYAKGILADTVLSFFEDTLEDSVQTERYLRAFVIGMKTTKMSEIFKIMEDKIYLREVIAEMDEGIHKSTLQQYEKESDAMRMKLIKPIYNRMDMIMGDPFLMDCFKSENELDFVKILSQKKAFIFDVSKSDGLTPKQINLIGNLLMTKINLAMQFRKEDDQFPFFVIVDEPHQFNRSSKLWESMAVESRKWRVSFTWLFHYWEQIPKQARTAIKNALPHYTLYPTSKETWKAFAEEVAPFDLSECMALERYHAINILRVDGGNLKPFICSMAAPPSKRKKETMS